jgi:hypothetical protein
MESTHNSLAMKFHQQQILVELEEERIRLEALALKRDNLKDLLEMNKMKDDCCWVETRGGSYFLLDYSTQVKTFLQNDLTKVDNEVKEVCQKIRTVTDLL